MPVIIDVFDAPWNDTIDAKYIRGQEFQHVLMLSIISFQILGQICQNNSFHI